MFKWDHLFTCLERHNQYTDYNEDIEEERKGVTWNKTLRNKEGMTKRKLMK